MIFDSYIIIIWFTSENKYPSLPYYSTQNTFNRDEKSSVIRDSNPEPLAYRARALTTKLLRSDYSILTYSHNL